MKEYHKINSVYMRDPATSFKTFLLGEWSEPEFGYLAQNEWVFTEKVEGTNIRIMLQDGTLKFGGKTDNAAIPAFLVERLQERFIPQIARMREIFPDGACLYGEGYGAKIQKGGGNYRADQDFVLFDAHIGEFWLGRPSIEDIADKLGLDVVPIVGMGTLLEAIDLVQTGFNSRWGSFKAEGLVVRPKVELRTRSGHRIITKIKHKDFQ